MGIFSLIIIASLMFGCSKPDNLNRVNEAKAVKSSNASIDNLKPEQDVSKANDSNEDDTELEKDKEPETDSKTDIKSDKDTDTDTDKENKDSETDSNKDQGQQTDFDQEKFDSGAVIYKAECSSCHGELAVSSKLLADAERIRKAIVSIPNMQDITLSNIEIENLVYALNMEPNSDSNTPGGQQNGECKIDWENFSDGADLACFETPEDVLKNLPEKVRPNWMMMHTSRSNQFASMENPRVILMAPNGKFIVTVETVPNSKTVEVAVFDYNTNTWDLVGLTYDSEKETEIERETCKACHSQSPRPNWTAYNSWPGTVGDRDKITAEELDLLNAAKQDNTSPVYQYLTFQNNYPLEGVLRPRVNYGENGNNQIMNFFLAKNAGRALTSAVMSNDDLSQNNRLALAYELACTEDYAGIQNKLMEFGYNYQDIFGFHRTGDQPVRMWIGFNRIDFPAGILLLDALLKDDPNLATTLPELSQTLKDPRLKALFNNTLADHPGWSQYDFGFQQEHYNTTQSPSLSCAAMSNLIN
ncbi:MAG: cytochrome c [Oligoflexales bacterium]